MDTDPFEKVESFNDPSKNGRKIGIFASEEFTKFLTVLDPDWLPFLAISGFTGLRRSEIEKLEWSEIKPLFCVLRVIFKPERSLVFHDTGTGWRTALSPRTVFRWKS